MSSMSHFSMTGDRQCSHVEFLRGAGTSLPSAVGEFEGAGFTGVGNDDGGGLVVVIFHGGENGGIVNSVVLHGLVECVMGVAIEGCSDVKTDYDEGLVAEARDFT